MRPFVIIPILLLLAPAATGQDSSPRTAPLSNEERAEIEVRGKFHFTVCDADANGWISFREAHASLGIDKAEYRGFDTSGDGRLSSREFRRKYPRMLELFAAQAAKQPRESPGPLTEPESKLPLDPKSDRTRLLLPPVDPGAPIFPFPTPEDLLAAFDRDASNGLSISETSNALAATGGRLSVDVLFGRSNRDASDELELAELGPLSFFIAKRIPERFEATEELVTESSVELVPTRTASLGLETEHAGEPELAETTPTTAPEPALESDPATTQPPSAPTAAVAMPVALERAPEPATDPLPRSLEPEPQPKVAVDDLPPTPSAEPEPTFEVVLLEDALEESLEASIDELPEPESLVLSEPPGSEPAEVEEDLLPILEVPSVELPLPVVEPTVPVVRARKRRAKRTRVAPDMGASTGSWIPRHFGMLDADKDGGIDASDLERLLAPARSSIRVSAVIAALDLDGDGRLNPAELVRSLGGR